MAVLCIAMYCHTQCQHLLFSSSKFLLRTFVIPLPQCLTARTVLSCSASVAYFYTLLRHHNRHTD